MCIEVIRIMQTRFAIIISVKLIPKGGDCLHLDKFFTRRLLWVYKFHVQNAGASLDIVHIIKVKTSVGWVLRED